MKVIFRSFSKWNNSYIDQAGGHTFQNYEVIKLVDNIAYNFFQKLGPIKSAIVIDDKGKPRMILPFRRFGKTIAIIGTKEHFDYSDMLIDSRTSIEEIEEMLRMVLIALKQEGIKTIQWGYLESDGFTYKVLHQMNSSGIINYEKISEHPGVKIDISTFNHYDAYNKSLSKHVKQNLRTSYNRLFKDKCVYEFNAFYGDSLKNIDSVKLDQIRTVYENRQSDKYGHTSLKHKIFRRYFHYALNSVKTQNGFYSEVLVNGKIACFMSGFANYCQRKVEIPILAMDKVYHFYSPGMLLVNETIKFFFNTGSFYCLDLCRGNEKYKTDMGGVTYNTIDMIIELKI